MASLRAMQSHGCTTGYPAHGAVIPDLRAKISGELAQKTRRERQVLETLEKVRKEQRSSTGPRKARSVTVQELVALMHGSTIDQEGRARALEPFMDEVLRKLAEDGKVAFEIRDGGKRWFAIGRV